MADPAPFELQIQDAVARADHARRVRETGHRLWAAAPLAGVACLAVAIAGRFRGWAPLVTLLVLAISAAVLALYVLVSRRRRALSDADVSHIDADAGLHGELRSAHWFARTPERDDWIRFHLSRAAEQVGTVDWAGLYPPPAAGRAKLATGLLAVAAIALAVLIPGGAGVAASDARAARTAAARKPGVIIALPADVRKQLEDMLVKAERGEGRALTAAEVRDLLARLDALAHGDPAKQNDPAAAANGQAPDPTKADMKAFAERAKKASESTSLEPSVRDALADVADKLNDGEQQNANAMAARDAQDAAVKPDATGEVQQSKTGSGKQDGASVQSVKDAAGGSSVGTVMMTTDETSSSRDGGLGLGGGTSDRNGGGHMNDLGAALRKETIDASADLAGENVQTDKRRNTEHADAGAAFTHAAAQPAERGSSTAPPPVPESRRAAVKSYFIRKQ